MDPQRIRNGIKRINDYRERNGNRAAFFRLLEGATEEFKNREYSDRAASLYQRVSAAPKRMDGPLLSVIIPVCDPDPDDFAHLLDSLIRQSYGNFETVIADGGKNEEIRRVIEAYTEDEEAGLNIRYLKLEENLGISGNTNEALKEAKGEYAVFVDHDDLLEPDALLKTLEKIEEGALVVYTDEDKYDSLTGRYLTPSRKGDFNLDLLLSNNYICHLLTVKTSIVRELNGFRSEYDGAQDHDFLLRLSRTVPREKIAHVPEILYHWRITPGSTSGDPESKLYAYDNGKKAIEAYFHGRGMEIRVQDTPHRGFYRPDYSECAVSEDEYLLFIDKRLKPETPDFEKKMAGLFIRPEVGIVGGKIIGRTGRTVCNGYRIEDNGETVPEYGKIIAGFSGYMHRASMIRETEAVSIHAFAIRRSLKDLISKDVFLMCSRVRERGYSVVTDPGAAFRIR